jgi:hypothetical protein
MVIYLKSAIHEGFCETDVETHAVTEVTARLLVLQHAALKLCRSVHRYQHHKL